MKSKLNTETRLLMTRIMEYVFEQGRKIFQFNGTVPEGRKNQEQNIRISGLVVPPSM